HPSTGTIDNGNFDAAGLYYITSGDNPVTASSQFDAVLTNTGIGGPLTPPFNPAPGAAFELKYNINCDFGMPTDFCNPGFIWGPADMQDVALPPGAISPGVCWNFIQAAVLPVTVAQFDASLTANKTVKVSWATAEEINSDYFSVERSADGSDWQSIGKVLAKGNSSGNVDYTFIDPAPLNALNYYRLKIVDRDAKFKYSKTATVSLDGKTAALVVYNNPFNDQIRIKLNSTAVDNLSLTLTDMLGRTYSQQFFHAQAGDNFINIVPTGASAGLYILNIKGKHTNQTVKLVKE
ncbi:MAG TPA: T9SS type A sorting domain-containing protein, partial [Puia sp.]|nr:T9SS type A sorting domain-containing protein [Puia sp.]